MTLPNRPGYKPPVRTGPKPVEPDAADRPVAEVTTAGIVRGPRKGKGRKGKKRKRGDDTPAAAEVPAPTPGQPPSVPPEVQAMINTAMATPESREAFQEKMKLIVKHPLFPALVHTGNENVQTSIQTEVGSLFDAEKSKQVIEKGSTAMRDHALGRHPQTDNFLINWIRLLEAYQIEIDAATSAAQSFITNSMQTLRADSTGSLLTPVVAAIFGRTKAPIRPTVGGSGSAAVLASLPSSATNMVQLMSDAMARLNQQSGPSGPPSEVGSVVAMSSAAAKAAMQSGRKAKRTRPKLSDASVWYMRKWILEHFTHPYPSQEEKQAIARKFNLQVAQVTNFFTNTRRRVWQPVVKGTLVVKDLYRHVMGAKPPPVGMVAEVDKTSIEAPVLTKQQAQAAGVLSAGVPAAPTQHAIAVGGSGEPPAAEIESIAITLRPASQTPGPSAAKKMRVAKKAGSE